MTDLEVAMNRLSASLGGDNRGMSGLEDATEKFIGSHLASASGVRLHATNTAYAGYRREEPVREDNFKPQGFWYGFGASWLQWCLENQSDWLCPLLYEVVLDQSRVLSVTNLEEFDKFEDEYQRMPDYLRSILDPAVGDGWSTLWAGTGGRPLARRLTMYVDYARVRSKYAALEISPYQWKRRLESAWYYPWDCASGCVWDPSVIVEVRPYAAYDPLTREFVLSALRSPDPGV